MTDSNLDILKTMLYTWTDDEVQAAWAMIAKEGEERRNKKTKKMKSELKSGDIVSWDRGKKTGKVIKVKYKKAIVNEKGMTHNWDIPFSMLTKVNQ
jgi:preprotein translocase subunit YajC